MKSRCTRFNLYFLTALLLMLAACRSGSFSNKKVSTLRLHLEVNADGTARSSPVPIYRSSPLYVNVENQPFLHEGSIRQASILEGLGGFELRIDFDRHGTWLLEQYSTAYKGKRAAVFSQFGPARWLAAPIMSERITNGVLIFTPDATREEAQRLVEGLTEVAKKMQKNNF